MSVHAHLDVNSPTFTASARGVGVMAEWSTSAAMPRGSFVMNCCKQAFFHPRWPFGNRTGHQECSLPLGGYAATVKLEITGLKTRNAANHKYAERRLKTEYRQYPGSQTQASASIPRSYASTTSWISFLSWIATGWSLAWKLLPLSTILSCSE